MFKTSSFHGVLLVCAALLPAWAASQEVLVEGAGVSITVDDVMADLQRLPPETRQIALSRPDTLTQLASGLYQRRALAAQAEQAKLDADPVVRAAVRIGRDRVLSEAQLAVLDKSSVPDDAALDALALNTYRANPERFRTQEQVRVRHILISGDTEAARAKAHDLLAQLKAGANFEELARQHSMDSGSAARGGDLGFFRHGRMTPPFEAAAFALQQPGELSGVVETSFGQHILRLEARRSAGIPPFAEVKDDIRKELAASFVKTAREREVQRMLQAARFNEAAFQALSSAQR